jgi:hypothetical protein
MLEKPQLLAKLKAEGKPSVEVPEEFKRKSVSFTTGICYCDANIGCIYYLSAVSRSGTANKILTEKEKQREKEKDDEPPRKRIKRYVARFCLLNSALTDLVVGVRPRVAHHQDLTVTVRATLPQIQEVQIQNQNRSRAQARNHVRAHTRAAKGLHRVHVQGTREGGLVGGVIRVREVLAEEEARDGGGIMIAMGRGPEVGVEQASCIIYVLLSARDHTTFGEGAAVVTLLREQTCVYNTLQEW